MKEKLAKILDQLAEALQNEDVNIEKVEIANADNDACENCGEVHNHDNDENAHYHKYANKLYKHLDKIIDEFGHDKGKVDGKDIITIIFAGIAQFIHKMDTDNLSKEKLLKTKFSIFKSLGANFENISEKYESMLRSIEKFEKYKKDKSNVH